MGACGWGTGWVQSVCMSVVGGRGENMQVPKHQRCKNVDFIVKRPTKESAKTDVTSVFSFIITRF